MRKKSKKFAICGKENLVLKGAESVHDVEKAYQLGLDGVIISNHGGRQVDVGQATIDSLKTIAHFTKTN
jgi:L-lactate dehydrogenase (cytochrome)